MNSYIHSVIYNANMSSLTAVCVDKGLSKQGRG